MGGAHIPTRPPFCFSAFCLINTQSANKFRNNSTDQNHTPANHFTVANIRSIAVGKDNAEIGMLREKSV